VADITMVAPFNICPLCKGFNTRRGKSWSRTKKCVEKGIEYEKFQSRSTCCICFDCNLKFVNYTKAYDDSEATCHGDRHLYPLRNRRVCEA
jgi:hypothetical protein